MALDKETVEKMGKTLERMIEVFAKDCEKAFDGNPMNHSTEAFDEMEDHAEAIKDFHDVYHVALERLHKHESTGHSTGATRHQTVGGVTHGGFTAGRSR